jgi:hypothetical protein
MMQAKKKKKKAEFHQLARDGDVDDGDATRMQCNATKK